MRTTTGPPLLATAYAIAIFFAMAWWVEADQSTVSEPSGLVDASSTFHGFDDSFAGSETVVVVDGRPARAARRLR